MAFQYDNVRVSGREIVPHVDLIVDGERYPSVTDVLGGKPKPWLDAWREKWGVLADRKTVAAKNIGTAFHNMAEALALDRDVDLPSNRRLAAMITNFYEWLGHSGFRALETELHVVSHTHKYQGTFDATGFLADQPKVLVLFDWKTSAGIYADMALQLAAYALAYREQTGIRIRRGIIVHVSKDKSRHKLTVKEYDLTRKLTNQFLKRLKEFRSLTPVLRAR